MTPMEIILIAGFIVIGIALGNIGKEIRELRHQLWELTNALEPLSEEAFERNLVRIKEKSREHADRILMERGKRDE